MTDTDFVVLKQLILKYGRTEIITNCNYYDKEIFDSILERHKKEKKSSLN